jgi:hypothetical protein
MRKIFYYLLDKYTKTEKDRLEILKVLHAGVREEYSEQNMIGNIGNSAIEFVMSHDYLRFAVSTYDAHSVKMIRGSIESSIESAIVYLEKETPHVTEDAMRSIAGFKKIKNK